MNIQQQFLDCNGAPFTRKLLLTPVKSPEISASFLTTADSYTFTASLDGTLSASVVANLYKVDVAAPLPATTFYLQVNETGSYVYSGSVQSGSAQDVYFELFNLVKDASSVKKVTLTPTRNYPVTFSGSISLLYATASVPANGSGFVEYVSLIPGAYQVDVLGKVTTTFFISVPAWEYTGSGGPAWDAKDLLIVKPSKGIPVRLNSADNSYVLTVSSSDARYVRAGGGGLVVSSSYSQHSDTSTSASRATVADSAASASHADVADVAISASYALVADSSVSASHADVADSVISASHADNSDFAISASHALVADFALNATNPNLSAYLSSSITASKSAHWDGSASYADFAANATSPDLSTYLSSSWTGSNTSEFAGTASHALVADTALNTSSPDLSAYLSSSWTGSNTSEFSGTSSFALVAQTALNASSPDLSAYLSSSWTGSNTSEFAGTSSKALLSDTASYWDSSSIVSLIGTKQDIIASGSTFQITASQAISASWAPEPVVPPPQDLSAYLSASTFNNVVSSSINLWSGTASFALSNPQQDLSVYLSSSTFNAVVSSSTNRWSGTASFALSAPQPDLSEYLSSSTFNNVVSSSTNLWSGTASFAESAPQPDLSSYLSSSTFNNVVSSSTNLWSGTASFAESSPQLNLSSYLSASWTGSNSSQFAGTASLSLKTETYRSPSDPVYLIDTFGNAELATLGLGHGANTYLTDGNITTITLSATSITASLMGTASYANTASWALNGGTTLTTGSTYPITSSVAISSSIAVKALTATSSSFASTTPLLQNINVIVNGSGLILDGAASIGSLSTDNGIDVINAILIDNTAKPSVEWTNRKLYGLGSYEGVLVADWNGPLLVTTASQAVTASFSNTASFALSNPQQDLSVYLSSSWTGSNASLFSGTASLAISSSYTKTVDTGSYSLTSLTSDFALLAGTAITASFALSGPHQDLSSYLSSSTFNTIVSSSTSQWYGSASYAPQQQNITASIISASVEVIVPSPLNPQDAATKAYVDNLIQPFGFDYYFRSGSSATSSYHRMEKLNVPLSGSTAEIIVTAVSASQYFVSFISPPLGVTSLNAGTVQVHYHIYRTGGAGSNAVSPELYLRHTSSFEQEIASGSTNIITTTVTDNFTDLLTITASIPTDVTDVLVAKFKCISGTGTPDMHFTVDGNTAAGVTVPVPSSQFVKIAGDTMTGPLTTTTLTAQYVTASGAVRIGSSADTATSLHISGSPGVNIFEVDPWNNQSNPFLIDVNGTTFIQSGSLTGSLNGTASVAISASYAPGSGVSTATDVFFVQIFS